MSIKKFCIKTLFIGLIAVQSLPLFAASSPMNSNNPLTINSALEKIEDKLEKELDKQYKVDWDFDLLFNNGKISIIIEYDQEDIAAFKQISKSNLEKLISLIVTEIQTSLGNTSIPIEGIIIEDDAKQPTYTFMYKDGKLNIN